MTNKLDVSGAVIIVDSATLEDERQNGTVDKVVAAATEAVRKYDSDGEVPVHHVDSLGAAVTKALELATASEDRDLVVIIDDFDTRDDDTAAIKDELVAGLDSGTMIVFAVVTDQPGTVDRKFGKSVDDGHAREAQVDVVYTFEEDINKVFGREVDEFLAGANA
ncbi:MAG TPA: hypothetical protein VLA88_05900 [Candidatus Saccharimonadales bacterium]|nr:hypothetical protein [Candidatus Saccharimonadales bacterium]